MYSPLTHKSAAADEELMLRVTLTVAHEASFRQTYGASTVNFRFSSITSAFFSSGASNPDGTKRAITTQPPTLFIGKIRMIDVPKCMTLVTKVYL